MEPLRADSEHRMLGRYELLAELARGGMAVVYLARQVTPEVIERPVVVKRMHGSLATSEKLVRGFLDEARLLTHVRHPNVVPIIDVVEARSEAFLVLEHVDAVSLATLWRAANEAHEPMPLGIASRILCDALAGLHAAHEAKSIRGEALGIVHRDVSPQNVLVGADGVSRLIDFGIAKAAQSDAATTGAVLKGKLGYFAPEQLQDVEIDRRLDVFAAAVVLHELLTGKRLFGGDDQAKVMMRVLIDEIPVVSTLRADVPAAVDDVLEHALARHREDRYATAAEFLEALAKAAPPASPIEVARYVERLCGRELESHRTDLRALVTSPPNRQRRTGAPLLIGAAAIGTLAIAGVLFARAPSPSSAPVGAPPAASSIPISTASAPPVEPPPVAAVSVPSVEPPSAGTTIPARRTPPRVRPPASSPPAVSAAPPRSPLHSNPYDAGSARP